MTACKFDYNWSEKNIEDMNDEEKLLRAFFLLLVPSAVIVMIKQGKSGKRFRELMVLANSHEAKAKCHVLVMYGKTFGFWVP